MRHGRRLDDFKQLDMFERRQGPSIETNMGKITVQCLLDLVESFNRGLVYLWERLYKVNKLARFMFFGAPCVQMIIVAWRQRRAVLKTERKIENHPLRVSSRNLVTRRNHAKLRVTVSFTYAYAWPLREITCLLRAWKKFKFRVIKA